MVTGDDAAERAQLWLNMALATGTAAFLLTHSRLIQLFAIVANLRGWQIAHKVQSGSAKVIAGTALTAVGLFGYLTQTRFF